MYETIKIVPSGNCALLLEFGEEISKKIHSRVIQFKKTIKQKNIPGIIELVPTYRSITVYYDPIIISNENIIKEIQQLDDSATDVLDQKAHVIEIPTLYGKKFGEDIEFVASHNNLSEEEVIALHSGTDYLVYMLGFTPGFTYLGGLSEKLATPRLDSPREKILAGSVGIAGTQTGIYPSETPGGWQLIGRTPLKLFDVEKTPPVFINAGDYIRYIPISEQEYATIEQKISDGTYQLKELFLERGDLHE